MIKMSMVSSKQKFDKAIIFSFGRFMHELIYVSEKIKYSKAYSEENMILIF